MDNAAVASFANERIKMDVQALNFYYGKFQALKGITLKVPEKKVTAFIGPSGCGKSTLLRVFNRMTRIWTFDPRWEREARLRRCSPRRASKPRHPLLPRRRSFRRNGVENRRKLDTCSSATSNRY